MQFISVVLQHHREEVFVPHIAQIFAKKGAFSSLLPTVLFRRFELICQRRTATSSGAYFVPQTTQITAEEKSVISFFLHYDPISEI